MEQLTAWSISRPLVLAIILQFAAATNTWAEAIGKVTEQTGLTEIQRNHRSFSSALSFPVEAKDTVVTAAARAGITFADDSRVQITEQSRLVIDSFVYDPVKKDAGKLGLKVAIGTVRFASGQIARHTPESLQVTTPTATVGVRGTDFTLTVDELGRSLIVLLPSCPSGFKNVETDCYVGEISVTTDMGVVIMNRAFQATTVESKEKSPTRPVILNLNENQISNILILTPPKAKNEKTVDAIKGGSVLDINALDIDLLKFDDLSIDYLNQKNRLNINNLDEEFLTKILDIITSQFLDNQLTDENRVLPNYKKSKVLGLKYFVEDTRLTLYRSSTFHIANVTVDKDSPSVLNLTQDGVIINQVVNRTDSTVITIKQTR